MKNFISKTITAGALALATFSFTPANAITLYSTGTDGNTLFTIDSTNGVGTVVGGFGHAATYALAFDASNVLYGVYNGSSNGTLATINTTTGVETPVGAATGIGNFMAIVFAPNGTLYGASWNTNALYTMNKITGAATLVGSLGFGGIMDLAFDSSGQLYGLSNNLYKINTATGAGTLFTTLSKGSLMGMTIDPSGRFLATDYSTSNTPLYQINTANGALTSLGNTGISNPMGLTFQVPEPASAALLGLGTLLLAARRRRSAQA